MFQPLEVTEARTIWIDSPSDDRLGFQDSSRVQIDRDPIGTGDFTETGDGFKAKLLGGMWPDDDELRLLVVGVVPSSEQADAYLNALVNYKPETVKETAWSILRKLVQIMPAWAGQQKRTIFVSSTLPRVKPETVKTAAVNSELNPDRKLSFDMFRIQVDAMLIANGHHATDEWMQEGSCQSWHSLQVGHKEGLTPKEFLTAYMEKINGGNETPSQSPPA